MKRNPFLILAGAVCISIILMRFTALPTNSFSWDVFGYYLYLPASIIHHDIGITDASWLNQIMDSYNPSSTLYQLNTQENGYSIKYTQGMAWLYLPFFLIAHLIAHFFGFSADGFSSPYQWAINLGMLCYFISGLWALFSVLKNYFKEQEVLLALLLLFFGTNLFQMSDDMLVHPHIAIFSLFAWLIYFTEKWYSSKTIGFAIAIGFNLGLLILVRPTTALGALIPLLWGINNLKAHFSSLVTHYMHLIIAALITLGIASLQMVYWKLATGSWFYFSYDNPGEGLDFLNPHTFKFLFSFRKGWFIYTPLALFMVWGFVSLYKIHRHIFFALFGVFIISLYVMSSWSTWYYAGGSFSSRTLVNIYPVLAFPFTAFIQSLTAKKRFMLFSIFGLCVMLNLFQTWQWNQKIIDQSRMTASYYFKVFGKTSIEPAWKKELLVYRSPEPNPTIENIELYDTAQVIIVDLEFTADTIINGIPMEELSSEKAFSKALNSSFEELTQKDHAWLVVSGYAYVPVNFNGELPLLVNHFKHKEGVYKYRAFEPHNNKNTKGLINYTYSYLTPEVRSTNDIYSTYWWHRDQDPIYVSVLTITLLERI